MQPLVAIPHSPPTNRIRTLVGRWPLIWFFVLTYAFSWPLALTGGLNPLAPAMAAIVVLGLTQGRSGMRMLLRRALMGRVPVRWYAAALLLPVLFVVSGVALTIATGAAMPTAAQLGGWSGLLVSFVVILVIGGGLEEVGWRGYALPALQERRSALRATAILAVLVAGWHLPLFLTGSLPWLVLPGLLAAQILYGWIFNSTGGSALLVVLAHTMQNTVGGEFFSTMFTGADADRLTLFMGLAYGLGAAAIVIFAGAATLSRRRDKVRLTDPPPLTSKERAVR